MQLERALRASGPLLIVLLGVILIVLSLVSMWRENRQEEPLNGIISFALAVMGLCAFASSRRIRLEGQIIGGNHSTYRIRVVAEQDS